MSMASILPIFIVAGVSLYRAEGNTFLEKYKNAIMPNLDKAAEVTTIEEKFLTPPKQNPDANDKLETIDESEAQKKALMDTSVVWK